MRSESHDEDEVNVLCKCANLGFIGDRWNDLERFYRKINKKFLETDRNAQDKKTDRKSQMWVKKVPEHGEAYSVVKLRFNIKPGLKIYLTRIVFRYPSDSWT